MTTNRNYGIDPRLQQAITDFAQLKRQLKLEPGIEETSNLRKLKSIMDTYLQYGPYDASIKLYELYRVKRENVYPNKNIRKRIFPLLKELIPLYKISLKHSLFTK